MCDGNFGGSSLQPQNSKISEKFEYDSQTHLVNWIKHVDETPGHIAVLGTCSYYDADARVNQRCDTFGNNYQITQDKIGRITRNLKTNDGIIQANYSYDANGNREVAWSDVLPKYYDVYSYTGNKLTGQSRNEVAKPIGSLAEGITYSDEVIPAYDAAGRRLLDTKNASTAWYHYNHLNQRTYKQVGTQSARQFAYDESGNLLGEYDLAGNALSEYIYLEGRPVAVVRNGVLYYITTDMNNVPRVIVHSSTGAVVWAWSYEGAFGEVKPVNYQPGNFEFNLRFPGQYYDQQSGLFYNHNRYYNPELGRYMEPDPIGLEGGLNMFAYAGNNPVMNVDPSGLSYSGGMVPMTDYQMSIGLNQSLNALNNMQLSFERASSNFISAANSYSSTANMLALNVRLPSLPQRAVDYSAGLGDALLLGTGGYLRASMGVDGGVNTNSAAYEAGAWSSFAIGTGRLAYAGIAKGGSILAATGGDAITFRQGLKETFRLGAAKEWRKPDLSKYPTDDALRSAAGRTNKYVNTYGSGAAIAGACGATHDCNR